MSYAFSAPPGGVDAASAVVLAAARCWRAARDAGRTVQPCLFATLRAHGAEMLAPVFDSLMSLYESALGRRPRVGEGRCRLRGRTAAVEPTRRISASLHAP
jgi:hypothetical protein